MVKKALAEEKTGRTTDTRPAVATPATGMRGDKAMGAPVAAGAGAFFTAS